LWHDRQLSSEDCRRFEEHLALCAECREELRAIASLSRLFAGARKPSIPADALHRLHQSAEKLRERDLLRIARWLTAAAAVLLVVGLAALLRKGPATSRPVATWEWAMLDLQLADAGGFSELSSTGGLPDITQWLEAGPLQNGSHE
jgi:predicted anti-sigma-YlaC factor YlaD